MGNTSTTGTKIRKGAGSIHRQALPDDPIFTRGFVFGGQRPPKKGSKASDEKKTENSPKKEE